MVKNILLTGHPGVGKTTMLKGIIERFAHLAMTGFYTEEIREKGIRLGFKAVAMNGSSAVFAHRNFQTGPEHRVGKYGVNLEALETLVLAQLSPQGKAAHLSWRSVGSLPPAPWAGGRPDSGLAGRHPLHEPHGG